MNRSSLGIVAAMGLLTGMMNVAQAQVFFAYDAPFVHSAPVYVPRVVHHSRVVLPPRAVVTAAYAQPYAYSVPVYAQQPIVPMQYSPSVVVAAQPVVAAPVVVAGPSVVRETTRVSRHDFAQTVRVNGPLDGPHYSRVRVHSGPFGTTVRERVR